MEYEYERDVVSELENLGVDYQSNAHYEMAGEVEEVYRKAKAFDKIRNVDKDFYKEYGYYPNEEEWWYDSSNIIEKYEELHGGQIK